MRREDAHTLDLEVRRDALGTVRVREGGLPQLRDGEALLRIECFGLSANNISYALLGDALGYWGFFPAPTAGAESPSGGSRASSRAP